MRVISIGTDRNLFKGNSEVRRRIIEYGKLVGELHVIVMNKKREAEIRISENTFIYPTNSKSRWFYVFDSVRVAEKILAAGGGPWLITSQDPFECGFSGWLLKRKFKIPLQLQVHTDFLNPYFKKESFLNRIRVLIAGFLIGRADCVRAVSARIRKALSSTGRVTEDKVAVLPIWVDAEKIKNSPIETDLRVKYPQFDFIILMAGRLTKEKNIGLAIRAMAGVARAHPAAGLVIIGEGPMTKKIKLQITNYKLQKNVMLETWTDDLPSCYKTADLFLLTSNYEGYGRTLVEAAAAGCGLVSTDVGIADELLGKNGVCPVGAAGCLEEKILTAIRANGGIRPVLFPVKTKEQYLSDYKKLWETCGS